MKVDAVIAGQRVQITAARLAAALGKVEPGVIRTHYVMVAGRRYPVKQAVAVASGVDQLDVQTNHARQLLRRLGLTVKRVGP